MGCFTARFKGFCRFNRTFSQGACSFVRVGGIDSTSADRRKAVIVKTNQLSVSARRLSFEGKTLVQQKRLLPTKLTISLGLLVLVFSRPLLAFARFAAQSDLYSHTLLIPLISGYLIWWKRGESVTNSPPQKVLGVTFLAAGTAVALIYAVVLLSGRVVATQDYLACLILSFVLCIAGLCAFFLGGNQVRSLVFPLTFLGFMVPFPLKVESFLDHILQTGSATVALILFKLLGTPVYYTNLVFKLPGISLEVAPECSGIHSSLALLIVSVLAAFFLLSTPAKRITLVLATLPLAFLRNGVRIVTIGELCIRVGPEMINSDIHRRGGPLFFVLSLLPFSMLLWWLRRSGRPALTSIAPLEE